MFFLKFHYFYYWWILSMKSTIVIDSKIVTSKTAFIFKILYKALKYDFELKHDILAHTI